MNELLILVLVILLAVFLFRVVGTLIRIVITAALIFVIYTVITDASASAMVQKCCIL